MVSFRWASTVELFQADFVQLVANSERNSYDVAKGGKRFLINAQARQKEPEAVSVVLNWTAKLAK
jgi:hypothetical protein